MPTVDPDHGDTPDFPDPALIDALATAWLQMAEDLRALSGIVGESLNYTVWTGDARNAAMQTAADVGNEISATAALAQQMGEQLQDYAGKIRTAIAQHDATILAAVLSLAFGALTVPLIGPISAVTTSIMEAISEFGVIVETLAFSMTDLASIATIVTVGTRVFNTLTSLGVAGLFTGANLFGPGLISDAVYGLHPEIDPTTGVVFGVMTLFGGLGMLDTPGLTRRSGDPLGWNAAVDDIAAMLDRGRGLQGGVPDPLAVSTSVRDLGLEVPPPSLLRTASLSTVDTGLEVPPRPGSPVPVRDEPSTTTFLGSGRPAPGPVVNETREWAGSAAVQRNQPPPVGTGARPATLGDYPPGSTPEVARGFQVIPGRTPLPVRPAVPGEPGADVRPAVTQGTWVLRNGAVPPDAGTRSPIVRSAPEPVIGTGARPATVNDLPPGGDVGERSFQVSAGRRAIPVRPADGGRSVG
ncbi:MAG TPA: hypothetical protein VHA75_04925, partial [Rugosimonospora sp.]|nr:hypothetical protein [Rugosimonospora sp.]